MEGDLAKLRVSRRVYIRHLENRVTDINNLIHDFDFGNEEHTVEIKTLKATFSKKTEQIKLLDNHTLPLFKTEEFENELDKTVIKDDKNTWILTKIEHVLHKIKIKESQTIPPVQNFTLQDNEAKDIPVKLPKLEIVNLMVTF